MTAAGSFPPNYNETHLETGGGSAPYRPAASAQTEKLEPHIWGREGGGTKAALLLFGYVRRTMPFSCLTCVQIVPWRFPKAEISCSVESNTKTSGRPCGRHKVVFSTRVASAAGNGADGSQQHHQMFLLSAVQGFTGDSALFSLTEST